jgi:Spy/CpxP family protein refolding chaperone
MDKILWGGSAVLMIAALALAQHRHSPYAGQETRTFKSLSEEEVQALLSGQGMGLAKAAELNHYPGPRHVLDLATHLQLSKTQRAETQQIYDRMHQEVVRLGALIVDKERELDHLFATEAVDAATLQNLTKQLAQLQGALRLAHLQAHVEMKRVLSREQIDTYDALQGYTANAGAAPPTEHHRRQH